MVFQDLGHACLLLTVAALVNVEVFRAHVEVLLLTLCEVESVRVNRLLVVVLAHLTLIRDGAWLRGRLLRCAKDVEGTRLDEHFRVPLAHLTVVTYTHDLVIFVVADHREAVDRVLVAVLGQTTLLDRLRSVLAAGSSSRNRLFLRSDVPLK